MPDGSRVNISTRSGRVRVDVRDSDGVEVRAGTVRTEADGSLTVGSGPGSAGVDLGCPAGTDLIVGTASGAVEIRGDVGAVRVTTASGRIDIERARDVDVRTASGLIKIGACTGGCRIVSKSSRVRIGTAQRLDLAVTSGRVEVGEVEDATVRTVSGRVEMTTRETGTVDVRSVSGRIEIAVPRSRRPALRLKSLSGRVRRECDQGVDGEISVATTSGTITVAWK
jgi:DUF4097 and DUF4098 domain-containing protein YvlB